MNKTNHSGTKNLTAMPTKTTLVNIQSYSVPSVSFPSLRTSLVAVWTNRIVMHKDVPVASLRRCVKSRCLHKSDRIAKS